MKKETLHRVTVGGGMSGGMMDIVLSKNSAEMKMDKRLVALLMCLLMISLICGCRSENAKVRDLDFTVLREEKVPEVL
jgi:hypothetical protein